MHSGVERMRHAKGSWSLVTYEENNNWNSPTLQARLPQPFPWHLLQSYHSARSRLLRAFCFYWLLMATFNIWVTRVCNSMNQAYQEEKVITYVDGEVFRKTIYQFDFFVLVLSDVIYSKEELRIWLVKDSFIKQIQAYLYKLQGIKRTPLDCTLDS